MKCRIQWIDERGNPTPDDNEAIGYAVNTQQVGKATSVRRYPICAEHKARMPSEPYKDEYMYSAWHFEHS
jgi:hypothetical protein